LRLHVMGSTISAVIQVPLIYFAAVNYGAVGAGIAWFSFRTLWFFWWTPIVHSRFVPGLHWSWLIKDILPIVGLISAVALLLSSQFVLKLDANRLWLFAQMLGLGLMLLGLSSMSAPVIRMKIISKIKKV